MSSKNAGMRSSRDIELEVVENGQEWMRQRLEQKLQEEADPQQSESSPPAKAMDKSAKRRRHG
jgi:hypothetical protein